jgi:ribosome-binding factor A
MEYQSKLPAFTTITEVRMSGDLRQAKVYYSVMGTDGEKTRVGTFLNNIRGKLRSEIADRIKMRFHPTLEFQLDSTLDYADRIDQLLSETHKDQDPAPPTDELNTSD